jgi:hypothetical protein
VGVDDARCDDPVAGVDHPAGVAGVEAADRRHGAVAHRDVGPSAAGTGAVDQQAAGDQQVERSLRHGDPL